MIVSIYGRSSMFWALTALSFAVPVELPLSVKFSPSCLVVPQARVLVDDKVVGVPVLKNLTYIRIEPGEHTIDVIHPWCFFPHVVLRIHEDGDFVANVNGTVVTTAPIVLKHRKNEDKESLFAYVSPTTMIMGAAFMGGVTLLKSYLGNPDNVDKIKKWQEDLQKQMEEAQRQQG